eukprot:TRINITY_DN25781_c0_g1_i15.p1 TRINITY_DN25781_c0_g1~~TRINITY_DN25781_c0_g1_i15.p1  ORF type:complete len:414 (+),score=77.88 TRINITY_DN25781_c0_g1_i15:207-1448(+)
MVLPALLLVAMVSAAPDRAVRDYYATFDTPTFFNTSVQALQHLLLAGVPLVVADGARGLPMANWSCDYVRAKFPHSRIRQEGGMSDVNDTPMGSAWPDKRTLFRNSQRHPEGSPRVRPFYWDIAKAFQDEGHRQWGVAPHEVVDSLLENSAVPYWLPDQDSGVMGGSSEMWFHPRDAGAPAHMDPHCQTTVSFCFSGSRRWRMMVPPSDPHPAGYFDGHVYGTEDPTRAGEWDPAFSFDVPPGSATLVYPGMVHETLSTGSECSSSISQTFATPIAAKYYRAFWPRFAKISEDVGQCGYLVEHMATLGSGSRVGSAEAADEFARSLDLDGDGVISVNELPAQRPNAAGGMRSVAELISFHDVNHDHKVSVEEVVESWKMVRDAAEGVAQYQHKYASFFQDEGEDEANYGHDDM